MHNRLKFFILRTLLISFGFAATLANASVQTLAGFLNDSTNSALQYYDLTPALFGGDADVANNIALYAISVPVAGEVTIASTGFTTGGIDPYYTLFQGHGAAATFLDSNYAEAFSTGGDFLHALTLAAGNYSIAIGAFANMSMAENYGAGMLGDGFIGIGEASALGSGNGMYSYAFTLVLPDATGPTSVPEPSTILLASVAVLALLVRRKRP